MHLCARGRLKRRLYTACKEFNNYPMLSNLVCYGKEKHPRSVIYKESHLSYK